MESVKTPGNGHRPRREAGPTVGALGSSLQTLVSKVSIEDLRGRLDLSRRMKTNPYGTLALAVGAGYVLGGGLFSSLTRRLVGAGLKTGLRIGALALLKQQFSQLTVAANDRSDPDHPHKQGARS